MFADDEFRDQLRQLVELHANTVRYLASMHCELIVLTGEIAQMKAKAFDVPVAIVEADVNRKIAELARTVDQANVMTALRDGYLLEPPPTLPWWDRAPVPEPEPGEAK